MTKKEFNIENEIHHFGLDHLEVYGTFKNEAELFDKLDFDNSNYGELEDYSFTKNEVPKYKYKIIFTKENYSLFAYYKGNTNSNSVIKSKDKIVVYSTAFKLMEYEEILGFLDFYFDLRYCRRFDICIDLKIDIEQLIKYFNEYKTGREYKKSGKLETRYIGEVRNALNKRQIIRIYNKLEDIRVKRKIKLYEDYLIEKNITRIELEVRQELAKNISYKEVFNDNLLVGIFKNYLNKHTYIFSKIETEKITLYRPTIKLDPETFQSLYYKTQRKNIFLGHARTIFNMHFCPARILILEGLIQPQTEKILGKDLIDLLFKREREARNQARYHLYDRKDFENLLSNSPEND